MWTLLVVWAVVDGSYQDMFLVTSPAFQTQEQCMGYCSEYREQIFKDAMREYSTSLYPDKLYCVDQPARDFLSKKGVQVEQL